VVLVGSQGDQGAIGATGQAGLQGLTGPAGVAGETGAKGMQGPAGNDGQQGLAGNDGAAGRDGSAGAQGEAGLNATDDPDLQADLLELFARLSALESLRKSRQFNHIFVTEGTFDGSMGGLTGADAICQVESEAVGSLAQKGTYVAWLSDSATDARDRVGDGELPYVLVGPEELQVAYNLEGLLDMQIDNKISVTQLGAEITASSSHLVKTVWTNTQDIGIKVWTDDGRNCSNWTSADNSSYTAVGFPPVL
jgi:hypothetical protein